MQKDIEMTNFLQICDHFSNLQEDLGYESIWSISEVGFADLNHKIFTDKPRRVAYRYVDSIGEKEVSMLATNGSIKQLWFAAESCIRQSGTHHRYIENFYMQDDGSLLLVTGS